MHTHMYIYIYIYMICRINWFQWLNLFKLCFMIKLFEWVNRLE